MFRNWMPMTSDAVMLGVAKRIGLRLMTLSRGGRAAEAEAMRMVAEKSGAIAEAGMTASPEAKDPRQEAQANLL